LVKIVIAYLIILVLRYDLSLEALWRESFLNIILKVFFILGIMDLFFIVSSYLLLLI